MIEKRKMGGNFTVITANHVYNQRSKKVEIPSFELLKSHFASIETSAEQEQKKDTL